MHFALLSQDAGQDRALIKRVNLCFSFHCHLKVVSTCTESTEEHLNFSEVPLLAFSPKTLKGWTY